jgi:predicted TIM-barrel fold metal-dependent hydrolase
VPWSSGTAPARTKAPPNAADCHHHIYSSRFKVDANSTLRPGDTSVADYRLLHKRIGTSRNVIVQPDELRRLDAARVRGVRFSPAARGGVTTMEMPEPVARRIAPMGWHVEFNMSADMTLAAKDVLSRLPRQIVFDRLAHIPQPAAAGHPAFAVVADLMQKGRASVKLSGAYRTPRSARPLMPTPSL